MTGNILKSSLLLIVFILLMPVVLPAAGTPDAETQIRLVQRVRENDVASVRAMLDAGIDPEITFNGTRETPLMMAAHHGHVAMLELLLQRGANVNRRDSNGRTALSAAVDNHKAEAAKLLLTRGARFGDLRHGGSVAVLGVSQDLPDDAADALQLAVTAQDIELLDLLLKSGADIDMQHSHTGQTALMYAASLSSLLMVTALLERGASVGIKDNRGSTAIDFGLGQRNVPDLRPDIAAIMKLLLDKGMRPQDRMIIFHYRFAIDSADRELLEKLLARVGPDSPPGAQESPFHYALWSHKPDIAVWLQQHGADTEWRDREGKTAIFYVLGDPKLFELLRSHGADIDARDSRGHGLLWCLMAIEHPDTAVFKAVLESGSNADELHASGGKFLYEAVKRNDLELVRLLLDQGVDMEFEYAESGGRLATPLAHAIHVDSPIVMQLLAAGADPNHLTPGTDSFLVRAVGLADEPLTRALLKAGADVNQVSRLTGDTVLQTAVIQLSEKRLPLAHLLLDAGARADFGDPVRNDQMMSEACTSSDITLVKALIDAGARVNPSADSVRPPLFSAAGQDSVDIMSLLLGKGALVNAVHHDPDIWHENKQNGLGPDVDRTLVDMNYTALLYAAKLNNRGALELLLKSGAGVDVLLHSGMAALQIVVDGGQHELDVRTTLHKRQYSEKLSARSQDRALLDDFYRETTPPGRMPMINTAGECVAVECLNIPTGEPVRQRHSNKSPDNHVNENVIQVIDLKPVVVVESVEEFGARKLGFEQQKIRERLEHYQPQMIATLIAAGADVNRQDTVFGLTPLMQAIKAGRVEAVRLLVQAGARLDLKDFEGRTAAAYAVAYPNPAITAILNRINDMSLPPGPASD